MHVRFSHMGRAVLLAAGLASGAAADAETPPPVARVSADEEYAELRRELVECGTWDRGRLARETLRSEALILPADRAPLDVIRRRTAALLADLRVRAAGQDWDAETRELAELEREAAAWSPPPGTAATADRELFGRFAALRRRIAFRNPLLDFGRVLFLKHDRQARGERHMVDQYCGFNARPAGGVYALEDPFGPAPVARSLLADAPVRGGRLDGRVIQESGSFISLDLDYDAKEILFAFTEAEHRKPEGVACDTNYWRATDVAAKGSNRTPWCVYRPESCYHVFKARLDGPSPVQLTDGPWNDFDPCFLPDGRVAFVSSRIGGQCRCGERPLPTFTLHAMRADGSDLIPLSWHDTNEWHPSVDHDGQIVYTRWDYVDRDSDVAHHLWRCRPDGGDPRALHGNYPVRREDRPWMELSIRAVPGTRRYVAVAAPHHGEAYGSLVLIDPAAADDGAMSQVRRLTPEALLPESESAPGVPHARGRHQPRGERFGTPWPLGEDYHLCVYDPAQKNYGIYLVDSFGNRELLYRDPAISCLDPIPLCPRPRPPVVPVATAQAEADRPAGVAPDPWAVVTIQNVCESRQSFPPGTRIRELRVVNLFPKDNAVLDAPDIGAGAQSLCRGLLGSVPVEEDGSAHFRMPAGASVYFQLVDDRGRLVQTMRSATYAHPGERLGCVGCHEPAARAPAAGPGGPPLAMRRPPSELSPGPSGSYPLTFPRLVQPVLDRNCVACHDRERAAGKARPPPDLHGDRFDAKSGRSAAFEALRKYAWSRSGGNGVALQEPQYSTPGESGAPASKLWAMLERGHHDVRLPDADRLRLTLWLDLNSNFYGAYHDPERQAHGEIVRPVWGVPAWLDFETLAR